jgi:hypothetical protein
MPAIKPSCGTSSVEPLELFELDTGAPGSPALYPFCVTAADPLGSAERVLNQGVLLGLVALGVACGGAR